MSRERFSYLVAWLHEEAAELGRCLVRRRFDTELTLAETLKEVMDVHNVLLAIIKRLERTEQIPNLKTNLERWNLLNPKGMQTSPSMTQEEQIYRFDQILQFIGSKTSHLKGDFNAEDETI
jgi:hypothetical protein